MKNNAQQFQCSKISIVYRNCRTLVVVNTFTTHVPEIPIEETHENNGVRADASNRHSRKKSMVLNIRLRFDQTRQAESHRLFQINSDIACIIIYRVVMK